MTISAQVSVYPLRQEHLSPAVEAVKAELQAHRLHAEVGGDRVGALYWSSTLFPGGSWNRMAHVPLGDVIGIIAELRDLR